MMTTEHKRNLVRQEINLVSVSPKRPRGDISFSTKMFQNNDIFSSHSGGCLSFYEERKEKIGEKIAALQQLVSPYGKTDTASVLHDAMEYINFLHDQVKVLSAPYLLTAQPTKMQKWDSRGLRSRGLCVMPLSFTDAVTSSNGADIWAPIKTTSPKI